MCFGLAANSWLLILLIDFRAWSFKELSFSLYCLYLILYVKIHWNVQSSKAYKKGKWWHELRVPRQIQKTIMKREVSCLCSAAYLDCDLESSISNACLGQAASFSTVFLRALIRERYEICWGTYMKFKRVYPITSMFCKKDGKNFVTLGFYIPLVKRCFGRDELCKQWKYLVTWSCVKMLK